MTDHLLCDFFFSFLFWFNHTDRSVAAYNGGIGPLVRVAAYSISPEAWLRGGGPGGEGPVG